MSGELMHETLPTSPPGMPATDLDLWSDEVLADPYPAYRQLRDIGPVVWLNRYGIAAFPRFAEVRSALARWQDYTSAQGVSSAPMVNAALPPAIINTDPPEHDTFRGPLAAQLSVASLAPDAEAIRATARAAVEHVLRAGTFDGVADLARPYSLTVVGDLAGLPDEERARVAAPRRVGLQRDGRNEPSRRPGYAGVRCVRRADHATGATGQRCARAVALPSWSRGASPCRSSRTRGRGSTPQ